MTKIRVIQIISCAAALVLFYVLYQHALGAVGFLLLSIFFFILAFTQRRKRKD
ncbi:hypothetical protein [Peribacillus saganii]|uniref:hypothetical protein n=1 Tax=Peribacillus saganii TaxID=2303992 RepID=UPI001313F334|nr:hypothetical protein [Peribacillus saganii]